MFLDPQRAETRYAAHRTGRATAGSSDDFTTEIAALHMSSLAARFTKRPPPASDIIRVTACFNLLCLSHAYMLCNILSLVGTSKVRKHFAVALPLHPVTKWRPRKHVSL